VDPGLSVLRGLLEVGSGICLLLKHIKEIGISQILVVMISYDEDALINGIQISILIA
jgi:hypothetical protein